MNAAVICELNPMHSGHRYLFEKIKSSGDDVTLTLIMSGNYVQRGDLAIADKYLRAKIAVLYGADLVLELPLPYSLSSAKNFAFGAVDIIRRLGFIDCLCFGSESDDPDQIQTTAKRLLDNQLENAAANLMRNDRSLGYGQAITKAYNLMYKSDLPKDSPNDLLGIHYVKELIKSGSEISVKTFKRIKDSKGYYSAAEFRKDILSDNLIEDNFYKLLAENNNVFPVSVFNNERGVLQRLRGISDDAGSFDGFYNCNGIGEKIRSATKKAPNLKDLIDLITSKDVLTSRARRAILSAYLQIPADFGSMRPDYTTVLSLNSKGADLLNKSKGSLKIITKPARIKEIDSPLAKLNIEADRAYTLFYPTVMQRDSFFEMTPYVLNKDIDNIS